VIKSLVGVIKGMVFRRQKVAEPAAGGSFIGLGEAAMGIHIFEKV